MKQWTDGIGRQRPYIRDASLEKGKLKSEFGTTLNGLVVVHGAWHGVDGHEGTAKTLARVQCQRMRGKAGGRPATHLDHAPWLEFAQNAKLVHNIPEEGGNNT